MTQPPFAQAQNLAAIAGLQHGFFGRRDGNGSSLNTSETLEDNLARVTANRRAAMAALNLPDTSLASLNQVHGTTIITLNQPPDTNDRPKADGLVTNQPDIALAIITADCAPILFADANAGVIGACHAGWKGAINGIIANTVAQMVNLGATASNIVAAIGPTISGQYYEVGPDFAQQALAIDSAVEPFIFVPTNATREHFDLPGFIAAQLDHAGITQIEDIAACTYQSPANYFSHRHTTHHATPAGRQVSIIARPGPGH